jgi:hypothetical protein
MIAARMLLRHVSSTTVHGSAPRRSSLAEPKESAMVEARKARAVGFNHVALEVGDIEEALAFYGRLFDFKLRGKSGTSAFIDLGDQFLALQKGRTQPADEGRHFGLVVDEGHGAELKKAGGAATLAISSQTVLNARPRVTSVNDASVESTLGQDLTC